MSYVEYHLLPEYFFYFILVILLFITFIYFIYFFKKSNDFSNAWLFTKILSVCSIIIMFCLLFYYEIISIYISEGTSKDNTESWLFTLLNALLLGAFMLVLGFFSENSNVYYKYSILIILIYMSISGFGYLGILIILNEPISDYLFYNRIHSNSSSMSLFISYNILLFTMIMFISFITENEKK